MPRYLLICFFALIGFVVPSSVMAAFSVPDCTALLKWAKDYDKSKSVEVASGVELANVFADEISQRVFGKRALDWDKDDYKTVQQAVIKCERQYNKQRDRASAKTLATARSAMGRSLRKAQTHFARIERSLKQVRDRLLGSPANPRTYNYLSDYDTSEEINQKYRQLQAVPSERVAALAKDVSDYRADIRKKALDKARQSIAELPDQPQSLLGIGQTVSEVVASYDDEAGREDMEGFKKAAAARRNAIRDKLAALPDDQRPMIFPECVNVLEWASAADITQPIRTPKGYLYKDHLDDKIVPVFGKPLDRWGDQDVSLFKEGMQICTRSRTQILESKEKNSRAIGNAVMLGGNLAESRTAVAAYKGAQKTVADQQKRMEAMEPTLAGIRELDGMRADSSLQGLPHQEQQRQMQFIQSRQRQIAAKLLDGAIQELGGFKEDMEGLKAIVSFRNRVHTQFGRYADSNSLARLDTTSRTRQQQIAAKLVDGAIQELGGFQQGLEGLKAIATFRNRVHAQYGRYADPTSLIKFENAFRQRDAELAAATLPEFKKKLQAVPVSAEGPKSVKETTEDVFSPRLARSPARSSTRPTFGTRANVPPAFREGALPDYLGPYQEAALQRVKELETAIHEQECKKTLAKVDLSSGAAKQEVLGPLGATTLGDVVCRLVQTGHQFHSYESPGLLGGKEHSLKVTVQPAGYQTVTLHKAEVAPGKQMLVGLRVADANVSQTLTVPQWQSYAALLTGQTAQAGAKMLETIFKAIDQQMKTAPKP